MTGRSEKTIQNAGHGVTVSGTLAAIAYGANGPAIMIEDDQAKTWASISKANLDMLLRFLGPTPLNGASNVMVTMTDAPKRSSGEPTVEDFTAYLEGALSDGHGQAA